MNDHEIEAEIQAKGLTAPRISPQDLEDAIQSEYYFTAGDGIAGEIANRQGSVPYCYEKDLDHVTFCVLVLTNGHRIVGINTGPVSAANFDADLARKLARQNALDQMWPLLGYALRCELFNRPTTVVAPTFTYSPEEPTT